jgi:hypothetical protein
MKFFYTCIMLLSAFIVKAQAPTTPGANLAFLIVEGNYLNLHWENGNGGPQNYCSKRR